MMKKLFILVLGVFCLTAWATDSFAVTWTNYSGYQVPTGANKSWNGLDPAPETSNPPGFIKRVGWWNIEVREDLTESMVQIWWGEDMTVLYKVIFPSQQAAECWLECRSPSFEQINAAIQNWPWTKPSKGLRHKWMPLSEVH